MATRRKHCIIFLIVKILGNVTEKLKQRISRETVIALYTARAYLPGFFSRKILLLVLILPIVDLTTDWINAGIGYAVY